MCDWKPKYPPKDYKCSYKDYGKSKDGKKDLCIFHSDQEDKDSELFYQGIMKIYKSKKHDFLGFIFPKGFSFKRLKKGSKADHLVFTDADFSYAVFFCDVHLSQAKFTGEGETDFSWATFSGEDKANFSGATFSGKGGTSFYGAQFFGVGLTSFFQAQFSGQGGASFINATFCSDGGTSFSWANFSGQGRTSFRRARFTEEGRTNFSETTFAGQGGTDFSDAPFSGKGGTYFIGATFSGEGGTNFSWASFSGEGGTNFYEAKFSGKGGTSFDRAIFSGEGKVQFSGKTFEGLPRVYFTDVIVENPDKVTFDGVDLNRVRFLKTDIRDINFNEIWWTNREYGKNRPKKRNMVFDETFQTGIVYQIIRWLGIIKEEVEVEKVAEVEKVQRKTKSIWPKKLCIIQNGTEENHYDVYRLYNHLRLNYEKTGRYHEAGDFFIGEMEMRRRGNFEKPFIRILLHLYRLFSLYGERPLKAFLWLLGLWLVFGFIYRGMGIDYHASGSIGFLSDLMNGLMISLDVLALRKVGPFYDVIRGEPIVPFIKAVETIFGALFLSLFLLAMNRKFRRTKD